MNTYAKNTYRLLAFSILIVLQIQTYAQTYIIDPGHTSVQTKVNRFGVVPVVGRFNQVSGTIHYDAENFANTKADVNIKSDSYSANNAGGEAAVKSVAFLDASTYPEILFELSSLTQLDDQTIAKGFLELHGTRKEIEVPVQIIGPEMDLPTQKQSIGITGSITIDRTEYGVGKAMQLPTGRVVIANEVQIDFVILGIAE